MDGADFLAALVANCLRGALPPVDLRAVCLVRAMIQARLDNFSRFDTYEKTICGTMSKFKKISLPAASRLIYLSY